MTKSISQKMISNLEFISNLEWFPCNFDNIFKTLPLQETQNLSYLDASFWLLNKPQILSKREAVSKFRCFFFQGVRGDSGYGKRDLKMAY